MQYYWSWVGGSDRVTNYILFIEISAVSILPITFVLLLYHHVFQKDQVICIDTL
jgi:hypothetical protein